MRLGFLQYLMGAKAELLVLGSMLEGYLLCSIRWASTSNLFPWTFVGCIDEIRDLTRILNLESCHVFGSTNAESDVLAYEGPNGLYVVHLFFEVLGICTTICIFWLAHYNSFTPKNKF